MGSAAACPNSGAQNSTVRTYVLGGLRAELDRAAGSKYLLDSRSSSSAGCPMSRFSLVSC